jgi:feruloyl esterase
MRSQLLAACMTACAVAAALAQNGRGDDADRCERLRRLSLPDTTIRSAVAVDPGPFMPPDPSKIGPWYTNALHTMVGADPPAIVPAFCRVDVVVTPTPASNIGIEVWLPSPSAWNGKLLGTGNGGSGGAIVYPSLMAGVAHGYATANTDLGTGAANVSDYTFGIRHPELVTDYAYRATHVMTTTARAIISAYYDSAPRFSYFSGCSTGGHQGLVEAARYPDDYDGIVAGDPDTSIEGTFAGAWQYAAIHNEPGAYFPASKLPMIRRAVLAACDALDGLTDGVVDDPRRCHFDISTLQCKSGDAEDCFTAAQVSALARIYEGIRNPRTGRIVFPGIEPGTEGGPLGLEPLLTMPPAAGQPPHVGLARWARSWNGPGFDWDRDFGAVVEELGPQLSARADLTAFARHGKLLMYSGWADPAEPPREIVAYFDAVQKQSGSGSFSRLFMVPGMYHCAGGANIGYFDSLLAIAQWVESGAAPDRLIGARVENGVVTRTRPVCAYPQVARWTGEGSSDRAENFRCVNAPP